MTVTVSNNVTMADLLKSISCPDGPCVVKIVSVTHNSSTTYCSGTGCRRLLQQTSGLVTVEIIILSPQPASPVLNSTVVRPVSVVATNSNLVTDASVLLNATQLTAFIKVEQHKDDAPVPYLLIGGVCAACVVIMCLVFVAIYNAKDEGPKYTPVDTDDPARFRLSDGRLKNV